MPKPRSHPWIYFFSHTPHPIRKFSWFYLQNICRTLTCLSNSTLSTLVQAIIITHMGYCSSLLTDFLTFSSALLESYHNIAARVISSISYIKSSLFSNCSKGCVSYLSYRPRPAWSLSWHLLLLLWLTHSYLRDFAINCSLSLECSSNRYPHDLYLALFKSLCKDYLPLLST